MATYTPNYGLHQWVPEDIFVRTDFNEDLKQIDTVMGEKLSLITGSYTGDGTSLREIVLGLCPKFVLIHGNEMFSFKSPQVSWRGSLGDRVGGGSSSAYITTDQGFLTSAQEGFSSGMGDTNMNHQGTIYHYQAWV